LIQTPCFVISLYPISFGSEGSTYSRMILRGLKVENGKVVESLLWPVISNCDETANVDLRRIDAIHVKFQ